LGKSRLVEELRRRAGEVRTLSVECDEYETSTAYFAFREILRQALGLPADDRPGWGLLLSGAVDEAAPELRQWLPLLAVPLGVDVLATPETASLDEKTRRERVEEYTHALLVRLLPEPTLFDFEDGHRMDDASAGVLRRPVAGLE